MKFVHVLLISFYVRSSLQETIVLNQVRDKYTFKSPHYPRDPTDNYINEWVFVTRGSNEKVKIFCDDFRLIESNPCQSNLVTVDDGETSRDYCGAHYDFIVISKGDTLKFRFHAGAYGRGALFCTAKRIIVSNGDGDPKPPLPRDRFIEVETGSGLHHISNDEYPQECGADEEISWTITTRDPNAHVGLYCDKAYLPRYGECQGDYLEIDSGSRVERLCDFLFKTQRISERNVLKVKIHCGPHKAGAFVHCVAQGVANKKSAFHYLGADSEEIDSSEHGGPPGRRGTTCSCGKANKDARRIVGGKEATPNAYPFVVGITDRDGRLPFCGGSIITEYHVLTAAHCVNTDQKMAVVAGEHVMTNDRKAEMHDVYYVKEVFIYPDYIPEKIAPDAAVLLLERKIQFNQNVSPVCMPTGRFDLTNKYVKAMGWGATSLTSSGSVTVLKEVNVRVVDLDTCVFQYSTHDFMPQNSPYQMCTYSKNGSTCYGDSGGPLVWLDPETNRYTQVGIASFVTRCHTEKPNGWAYVPYFIDWINGTIAKTQLGAKFCMRND